MGHPIENTFPNLRATKYAVTSPETAEYNCIAWAGDDNERWWWPDSGNLNYWPSDVPREPKLKNFVLAYGKLGYEKCKDGSLEAGFEKVALYADSAGKPKHAARQLRNGAWTSKLGDHVDIEHELAGLEGSSYGKAVLFLKRALN